MRQYCQILTMLVIVALVSACAQPQTRRVIGEVSVMHAPSEVHANQSFTITVTTSGSPNCTIADGADVQVRGLIASVTPFDRQILDEDVICAASLVPHPRNVQLMFRHVGKATIRIIGQDGKRIVHERRISVIEP